MGRPTVVRCSACSAPLQVAPGQSQATCPYCKAANRLGHAAGRALGTPASEPSRQSRSVVWLLLAAAAVVTVGTLVYAVTGGSPSMVFVEWYSPPCLVDANGDDVLDLAGLTGHPGGKGTLTAVDGTNGALLWKSGDTYVIGGPLMCLSQGSIGITRPDFRFDLYAATGGAPRSTILSDAPSRLGVTDECLQMSLIDGSTVGIMLPSGDRGDCMAEPTRSAYGPPLDPGSETRIERDGTSYVVTRKTGTPTLRVRAERDGKVQWNVPLRYVAIDTSQNLPLAVTPDMVVIYGTAPSDSEQGVLVGLDRATGTVRYEAMQGSTWSSKYVSPPLYNGRYVVMAWGFGLHAYDPITGARKWSIGGR